MEKLTWLEAASAVVLDRTPEQFVSLLMVGLAVAMAAAGAYQLALRGKAEPYAAQVGVMLVGNLLAVAVALTMVRREPVAGVPIPLSMLPGHGRGMGPGPGHGPPGPGPGRANGFLEAADGDRDGHLTPDEAADFVRVADEDGVGWIDGASLRHAMRRRLSPPNAAVPGGGGPDGGPVNVPTAVEPDPPTSY